MKNNKYLYLWIVQGRVVRKIGEWGIPLGWEDLGKFEIRQQARENLKACQDASKVKHRLIKRREANPNYQETLKP